MINLIAENQSITVRRVDRGVAGQVHGSSVLIACFLSLTPTGPGEGPAPVWCRSVRGQLTKVASTLGDGHGAIEPRPQLLGDRSNPTTRSRVRVRSQFIVRNPVSTE